MPEINAYGDTFRDWEGLGGACKRNLDLVPGVEEMTDELGEMLSVARELKLEQEDLEGRRRAVTQRLLQLVFDGREMARKVRSFVKARLGSRDERLSQFGIPVIRTRIRKGTSSEKPAPGGGTPPPVPEATSPNPPPAAPVEKEKTAPPATSQEVNPR